MSCLLARLALTEPYLVKGLTESSVLWCGCQDTLLIRLIDQFKFLPYREIWELVGSWYFLCYRPHASWGTLSGSPWERCKAPLLWGQWVKTYHRRRSGLRGGIVCVSSTNFSIGIRCHRLVFGNYWKGFWEHGLQSSLIRQLELFYCLFWSRSPRTFWQGNLSRLIRF